MGFETHIKQERLVEDRRRGCPARACLGGGLDGVHGGEHTRLHPHVPGVGAGAAPLGVPGDGEE